MKYALKPLTIELEFKWEEDPQLSLIWILCRGAITGDEYWFRWGCLGTLPAPNMWTIQSNDELTMKNFEGTLEEVRREAERLCALDVMKDYIEVEECTST